MVQLIQNNLIKVIAYITVPLGIFTNAFDFVQNYLSPLFTLILSMIAVITGILVIINWILKNKKLKLEIKAKNEMNEKKQAEK